MSTAKNTLDTEIDAFMEQLPCMLESHSREWVVFKGKECVGFRHCEQDAFDLAYLKIGNVPFLVRQVSEEYSIFGRYGRPVTIYGGINFN